MRIKHKRLRALHKRDCARRLPADQVERLKSILLRLQEASCPKDAAGPGFRLHSLKGNLDGWWSVKVSGNWRVLFRFEEGSVVDVDLDDYH